MERKMKLDTRKRQLSVVEGKLRRADEKFKSTEKERLRVEEELAVTKQYFEEFKRRPEEEKWGLGSSKTAALSVSGDTPVDDKEDVVALFTEEKVGACEATKRCEFHGDSLHSSITSF